MRNLTGKVRFTVCSDISSTVVCNCIFNASIVQNLKYIGIEYEIRNYCGRNIGADGNSDFIYPVYVKFCGFGTVHFYFLSYDAYVVAWGRVIIY